MRIVHILLGKANIQRMNGVNAIVHHAAEQQHAKGLDVSVWGLTDVDRNPADMARHYAMTCFKTWPRGFYMPPRLRKALITLTQGDCVLLHGSLIPLYYPICRLLRRRGVPWVVVPHGALQSESLCRNALVKRAYLWFFDGYILRHAAAIHAITTQEQRDVQRWIPAERHRSIHVVPNGLPAEHYRPRAAGEAHRQPVFGYIGRFEKRQKGLDILIDGFCHYRMAGHEGVLHLYGDGVHKTDLVRKIRFLGMEDAIFLMPPCYEQEKEDAFKSFDIFVHPSRWDVMPVATIEASMYGVPLMVSRETGMGDPLKQYGAGTVIEDNTPLGVCKTLVDCHRLWLDGHLSAMGARARVMAETEMNMTDLCLLRRHHGETYDG